MGYLENTTHQQYYQGNNLGSYQFCSLEDIINQFMVVYVGEDKIIRKCSRIDVAFHAQRALAELSFDTLKSVKAQEIEVPATLQMLLPHDYVNYTKLSWTDSAGIKHPIYPTRHTSNPFDINQDSDGNYTFPTSANLGVNMDFEDPFTSPWQKHTNTEHVIGSGGSATFVYDDYSITGTSNALTFKQYVHQSWAHNKSRFICAWQALDVSVMQTITLSATGTTEGSSTLTIGGTLTIGISHTAPTADTIAYINSNYSESNNVYYFDADGLANHDGIMQPNTLLNTAAGDTAQLKWVPGESNVNKELVNADEIDVSAYNTVYVVITSIGDFSTSPTTSDTTFSTLFNTNSIDDINITSPTSSQPLSTNSTNTSSTWDNYKSTTSSENNNDDYEDDTYWPYEGERYGLEPSHAQTNGSFYIDQLRGKIHFSSNISGKTVILDYISDSLGTESEMQVHKLAEEAMYRYILHSVASSYVYTQQLVPRLKKEKIAAIRQAKLRLSNYKLEELTQILRGKSKWIKH